jgi:hypothetical protein
MAVAARRVLEDAPFAWRDEFAPSGYAEPGSRSWELNLIDRSHVLANEGMPSLSPIEGKCHR